MSTALRVVLVIGSFLTTGYILRKIRQSRMKIEYAVFWILLSGICIVFSIFPGIPSFFSHLMGFQAPVNLIFLFMLFALIVKCFLNSVVISRLESQVEELARKIAIEKALEGENEEERKEKKIGDEKE